MKTLYCSLLIILALVLSSCNNDDPIIRGHDIDVVLYISVQDENGNDLLDPHNQYEKSIKTDAIKLIYLQDGEESIVRHNHYLIDPSIGEDRYILGLTLNYQSTISTTYVQWSEIDRDIFEAEIYRNKNEGKGVVTTCTSLKLNGKLVWPLPDSKVGRRITIIK